MQYASSPQASQLVQWCWLKNLVLLQSRLRVCNSGVDGSFNISQRELYTCMYLCSTTPVRGATTDMLNGESVKGPAGLTDAGGASSSWLTFGQFESSGVSSSVNFAHRMAAMQDGCVRCRYRGTLSTHSLQRERERDDICIHCGHLH